MSRGRSLNPSAIAARVRYATPGSMTMSMSRSRSRSGIGVTNQYDRQLVYRKRSMPRRKRRLWKRFVQKVQAVDFKSLGTKTFLLNSNVTSTTNNSGTAPTQEMRVVHLYAGASSFDADNLSAEIGTRDLYVLGQSVLGGGELPSSKLMFGSAILDITFSCISGAPAEIDVYDVVFRREIKVASANGFRKLIDLGNADQDSPLPGTNNDSTKPNYLTRGWTPFDSPQALSRFGIKILKKTKYLLTAGQTATYQARDARNRFSELSTLNEPTNSFARRGWTRTVLFIHKAVTGYTGDSVVNIGATRKYMYKIKQESSDQSTSRQISTAVAPPASA